MMNIHETDLDGALVLIADYLGLDAAELRKFAAADPHPRMGWDEGKGEAPVGSLFSVEGIILYALVRVLRPGILYELGTCVGASTTHLAAAIVAEGRGRLTTVDSKVQLSSGWTTGQLVPDGLRNAVKFVTAEGVAFWKEQKRADFVFADMMHSPWEVELNWRRAVDILSPGGVIVEHDAAHFIVGPQVRDGIAKGLRASGVMDDPLVLKVMPGDTGLAIWRKPGKAEPEPEKESWWEEPSVTPEDIRAEFPKQAVTTPKPSSAPVAKGARRGSKPGA